MCATGITFVIHCVGMNVFFGKMPLSYYVFGIMIQFVLTLGVRFLTGLYCLREAGREKAEGIAKAKKVLLIGAGKAGQMILRDIKTAKELEDIVCCIIDDNPNKWGRYIEGVPVVGEEMIFYPVSNDSRSRRSLWQFRVRQRRRSGIS
ncbi:MAG: nucleoside-diphosphate sugar epimerase/dehydratase [Blautia sp.]